MLEMQTVEYKREYNQKAQNAMLAFLNTDGGTLYVGISDDCTVYGINGNIDEVTRGITNSFRDSVTPDPSGYFKVEPEVRDGKYIIAVTVESGSAIPYCYTKYGLVPQGVYVRVGSNTVMATREHIRRMIKDNGTGQFIAELSIESVYRVDHPDYPPMAIRESYINALIHRDYYIEGSVLVSMFDDRLEFMSLGGTMPGVTHDLMLAGVSVTRNEKLAAIYKKVFVDYDYLIYSENFKNKPYYIISAAEDNYPHLTDH